MKRSTKGAIAAGAAAVLLLGGAGSLAFWSDEAAVDGGEVTAGTLALSDADCDTAGGWEYAEGNAGAGEPVLLIVPGDTISKECTFVVTATGDNLEAQLTTDDTATYQSDPEAASLLLNVDAEFAVDGTPLTSPSTITDENDGQTVTAVITVEFPYGTDEDAAEPVNVNDTQGITATLDDIAVTLIQTDPNAVDAQ